VWRGDAPGLALISPFSLLFVAFSSGALDLLILFWGMQYAWKAMVKPKVELDGPFFQAST
jgi:hypothetical protein